jgi:hypothetical protein
MPCDSTITITHDVGKWNEERVKDAIALAGLTGVVTYRNGQLITNSTSQAQADERITAVKKSYATLTLKTAAKKFGWAIKSESTTQTGLNQIKLFHQ